MIKTIRPRLKATARVALIGAAGLALTLVAASPASAAPTSTVPNRCRVIHNVYQQPVATIIADVEAPEDGRCGVGVVSLDVYRNGVLVGDISGGPTLTYRYNCVTTEPTVWSTNWDAPKTFNCG